MHTSESIQEKEKSPLIPSFLDNLSSVIIFERTCCPSFPLSTLPCLLPYFEVCASNNSKVLLRLEYGCCQLNAFTVNSSGIKTQIGYY